MHALENAARCSFAVVTPFPENLGRWSLNLGSESVGGGRFSGDLTSHGVVSASTSYENIPSFLITFWGLVGWLVGLEWLNMFPIEIQPTEELEEPPAVELLVADDEIAMWEWVVGELDCGNRTRGCKRFERLGDIKDLQPSLKGWNSGDRPWSLRDLRKFNDIHNGCWREKLIIPSMVTKKCWRSFRHKTD